MFLELIHSRLPLTLSQSLKAEICSFLEIGNDSSVSAKGGISGCPNLSLYGVNLTRYATLRTGVLLRVGRVIVPIVKAIYERDIEIRNFKPEKYYVIQSAEETNGEKVELTSKLKFTKDELEKAEDTAKLYNETGAVVTSVNSKKDKMLRRYYRMFLCQ